MPQQTQPQTPAPQQDRMSASELRQALNELVTGQTAISTQVIDLQEQLDELQAKVGNILDKFAEMPKAVPAAAAPAGDLELLDTTEIVLTFDPRGNPQYHAMGGKYTKFGARIWPEHLEALKIDTTQLKPGPNPWKAKVLVQPATATRAPKVIRLA
jgi:hypothetical protein